MGHFEPISDTIIYTVAAKGIEIDLHVKWMNCSFKYVMYVFENSLYKKDV